MAEGCPSSCSGSDNVNDNVNNAGPHVDAPHTPTGRNLEPGKLDLNPNFEPITDPVLRQHQDAGNTITVSDLRVKFGSFQALDGVDLEMFPGEIFCLLLVNFACPAAPNSSPFLRHGGNEERRVGASARTGAPTLWSFRRCSPCSCSPSRSANWRQPKPSRP